MTADNSRQRCLKTNAQCEGRTHDLHIMRLTRCLLRQRGTHWYICSPLKPLCSLLNVRTIDQLSSFSNSLTHLLYLGSRNHNLHIVILIYWQAEETLTNTGVWLQIIQGKGVSKEIPRVRVELTTFRLWDWRAAYCANEAHTAICSPLEPLCSLLNVKTIDQLASFSNSLTHFLYLGVKITTFISSY